VVTRFLERTPAELDELDRLYQDGLAGDFGRLAHRIKGAAATLTAEPIRALAARLQELGDSGDLQQAAEPLIHLRAAVTALTQYVREQEEMI
jgi:HPt (histidine-containing phosphotransfer) domain-containing protein